MPMNSFSSKTRTLKGYPAATRRRTGSAQGPTGNKIPTLVPIHSKATVIINERRYLHRIIGTVYLPFSNKLHRTLLTTPNSLNWTIGPQACHRLQPSIHSIHDWTALMIMNFTMTKMPSTWMVHPWTTMMPTIVAIHS